MSVIAARSSVSKPDLHGTAGAGARDRRPRPRAQPADRSRPPRRRRYGRAHARSRTCSASCNRGPSAASNMASIASHRWSRRSRRAAAPPAGSMACSRPTSGWRRVSRTAAQQEFWADRGAVAAGSYAPAGRSVAVDGGYLLSGAVELLQRLRQWPVAVSRRHDRGSGRAEGGLLPGADRGLYDR